jgi:hypothetical protein
VTLHAGKPPFATTPQGGRVVLDDVLAEALRAADGRRLEEAAAALGSWTPSPAVARAALACLAEAGLLERLGGEPAPSPSRPAAGEGGPLVSAVVVAYNGVRWLEGLLPSLAVQTWTPLEVVVVDNGSRDDSRARVRAMAAGEPRLSLLECDGNPGFAAACNVGAAVGDAPWLLFVNPDCELPAGALARLLAHARGLPRPGAIGADLRDAEGRRDVAARRHDLTLDRLLAARGGRDALALPIDEGAPLQPVEACSGALMLVARNAFAQVGGWDAGYRLHVEDLDFCRRLRQAGFAVAVANDVPVLHHRGVSSRARPLFVEWHKHLGLWRYWRRFEAPARAWAWRPLVAAGLIARFLLVALPGRLRRLG